MGRQRPEQGLTLVEVMVVVVLLGIVMTASSMVFVAAQQLFLDASSKSDVQANVMQALHRVSFELQNSGYSSAGTFEVDVLDNAGQGGTDILRFAIPMCVCGMLPFDPVSNVRAWGAPLVWGQDGCDADYVVKSNNKVDICHFPPGNPGNATTLSVNLNAVRAHLAHGDHIGTCGLCDPFNYNNRTIEYLVDADGQLLRNILDSNASVIKTDVVARQITDLQVTLDAVTAPAQHVTANIRVAASKTGARGRVASVSNDVNVLFRNR